MYISLSSCVGGFACMIAQAIKNTYPQETHFFDWVICSMKSINSILSEEHINEYVFDINHIIPNPHYTVVPFLNYNLLRSVHDFTGITPEALVLTNEKYKRRYIRLINTIKASNTITFIRFTTKESFDGDDILEFYKKVRAIKSTLNIRFILLIADNTITISDELTQRNGFSVINIRDCYGISEQAHSPDILKAYERMLKDLSKNTGAE